MDDNLRSGRAPRCDKKAERKAPQVNETKVACRSPKAHRVMTVAADAAPSNRGGGGGGGGRDHRGGGGGGGGKKPYQNFKQPQ